MTMPKVVEALIEKRIVELDVYLRKIKADQGGGGTYQEWLEATTKNEEELGHEEAVELYALKFLQ